MSKSVKVILIFVILMIVTMLVILLMSINSKVTTKEVVPQLQISSEVTNKEKLNSNMYYEKSEENQCYLIYDSTGSVIGRAYDEDALEFFKNHSDYVPSMTAFPNEPEGPGDEHYGYANLDEIEEVNQ